jgi:transcriptional regulator with GAF, ATPase, and Fis domain/tetratricopeptide (TPR) repeat protein
MSELGTKKGGLRPAPAGISADRAEFEKLLQLGNGQFECDNRQEALTCYLAAFELTTAAAEALGPAEAGAAEAPPLASPVEIVFLCRRIGEVYQLRAEHDAARRFLAEAQRRLETDPDDAELGQVLAIRGSIATDLGRFSQAKRLLKRAYELLKYSPDHRAFGALERRIGKLYLRMGRPQEARNYFESALATFRRIGDQRGIAGTLNNLGLIHKLACEWMEAIRVMEKGLLLNEVLADEAQIGALCINLGVVHLKLGQWTRAEECIERALASNARIGNRRGLANAYVARGNLAIRRRQWALAEESLTAAMEIAKAHGLVRVEGLVHEFLGDLAADRGHLDRAEAELTTGLALARSLGQDNELVGELGRRLGEVLVTSGRLPEAAELAAEALHIARKVGDHYEEALCYRLLARIDGLLDKLPGFQANATQVLGRLSHMGERWEQARTFLVLGDVWLDRGLALSERWLDEAMTAYLRAETLAFGLELPGMAAIAALKLASLERQQGRLDQALSRIGSALLQVGEAETELRLELIRLRGQVEDAIAAGFGPTAAEREAFQEVTKLYSGRVELTSVLENLVSLVGQRSGSNHAFLAWAAGEAAPTVRCALGFRRGEATRILSSLAGQVEELLAADRPLIATHPGDDPRLDSSARADGTPPLSVAVLPFQVAGQVRGLVYVERTPGNVAGPYRAAEIALVAMLTNVVAIAAVEAERLRAQAERAPIADQPAALAEVVTGNAEMLRILKLIERVADTPARVLLLGETGTGKGLIASALHRLSPRAQEPFLQVNCAALPEPLLESELFGHVHGAFTGAIRDKLGLFEEAGAGTIFLDEIDKMSAAMQAKLLHVLDRHEVRRVGDTKWRQIQCRVVSAANVEMQEKIRQGDFLEDLYYRLNEFSVRVPPLRDRPEDILILARYFLVRSASRMGRRPAGLDAEVERVLATHAWPGNVRELEKAIERMVVLAVDDEPMGLDLLPESFRDRPGSNGSGQGMTLREEVRRLEARLIGQALQESHWNKLRAARALHLSYPALLKKIREYELDRRRGQPRNGNSRKDVYSSM